MKVLLGFSDGEAFLFESKYETIEKVIFDIMSKRFIEHEGTTYLVQALVKVSPV